MNNSFIFFFRFYKNKLTTKKKEILKHTWPSHPDYDGLKIEISRIDDDIKILNRWKKFSENKETFEMLQNQIKRQNVIIIHLNNTLL